MISFFHLPFPSGVLPSLGESLAAGTHPSLAQMPQPLEQFSGALGGQLGSFVLNLAGAIAILLLGWIVATASAFAVKNLLHRTKLDNYLGQLFTGRSDGANLPTEQWAATIVYWIILTFALVAFLNALNLEVVSQPLNSLLQQLFGYLPRVGGAAVLLLVAWGVATLVRLLVVQGLSRFNLDEKLAEQTGQAEGTSPFVVNETIGNVLYWFIFLLFVPLVLSALNLPGLLAPVEGLIDQFLQAIPRILTAAIILAIGWFVARIVREIVSNLLQATQLDQLGTRLGLAATTEAGVSLSGLVGNVVYVLILIPAAVAALNELNIDAISDPAISMLEGVLAAVPQVLTAGLVVVVFYVVGKVVADLLTNVLRGVGFDNILGILGLPELTPPTTPDEATPEATTLQRTPSEIAGLIALVGIVLFGVVTATEILQFAALTEIVQAMLRVSARVFSGLLVFGVGLYFANLAFRLVRSMGNSQSTFLAQSARIAIIILVGAMGLQQMGVATDIVNLAFGLLMGAIAVALAIAFGLGSREIAAEQVRAWLAAFKQNS